MTTSTQRDEHFMRAALKEARKAAGRTRPNPAVGAVLVVQDRIVAKGHHRGAGCEHAEITWLRNFGGPVPEEAPLYDTLQPSSTVGRTCPCTSDLFKAGDT